VPKLSSSSGARDIDRKSLRIYKANLRYAHDKFSQLEVDMLFELYRLPAGHGAPWPGYLGLLLKRLFDSGYVTMVAAGASISIGNVKTTPDFLVITPNGQKFIDSLGLEQDD